MAASLLGDFSCHKHKHSGRETERQSDRAIERSSDRKTKRPSDWVSDRAIERTTEDLSTKEPRTKDPKSKHPWQRSSNNSGSRSPSDIVTSRTEEPMTKDLKKTQQIGVDATQNCFSLSLFPKYDVHWNLNNSGHCETVMTLYVHIVTL